MRRVPIALLALLLAAGVAPAEDDASLAREARELGASLEALVHRYYPDTHVAVEGTNVRAESDARDFLVHHRSKGGEWMDAVTERGPAQEGVVILAELKDGPYVSAKAEGTFDERYYVETRMVFEDRESNRHLIVRLRLPPDDPRLPRGLRPSIPEGFAAAVTHWVRSGGSPR